MKNKQIKVPISLKQILLFSGLIIFVLGFITFIVASFTYGNATRDAQVDVFNDNFQVAKNTERAIDEVVNSSHLLFEAQGENKNKVYNENLVQSFFQSNENVIFIFGGMSGFRINPKLEENVLNNIDAVKFEKPSLSKIEFKNYSEEIGIPSLLISYAYGNEKNLKYAYVCIKTDYLIDSMNERSFILDSDTNILISSDYFDNEQISEIVKNYVSEFASQSNFDNKMEFVKDEKNKDSNYFISVNKMKNNIYSVTIIFSKYIFESINRTTYLIIYLSLFVLFVAIIIIRIFSNTITNPIADLVKASNQIERGEFDLDIKPRTKDEIGFLTSSFIQMSRGLSEREKLMTSFSKFTNKTIAQKAASGQLALGGENREATIFFSDIRSFTAMSEKMSPAEVVDFLNQYMTRMVDCVNKTNGVVDKYIGDAIMAVWGAPESSGSPAQDALNAVTTALLMRKSLFDFNKERKEKNLPPVKIGCGINTGAVVAGQIGSNERMEYTVIGDAVNLASRTEALNKPFATDILITENTYALIKDKIIVEEMPGVHVKGKEDLIKMYAVINLAGKENPGTIDDVRKIIGTIAPDLSKVNTDDEEKKYNIQTK